MTPGPPRLARRLLASVLPRDIRGAIVNDLTEMFERDCRTIGATRARHRYWRHVMSFSARFLIEGLRERARPRMSWMDMKLGTRMLVKYPGLTIVGGLAMAFAIAVGAAAFEFLNQVVSPTLPLPDGHRIVGIRLWHTASRGVEEQALWDYLTWRGRLETIDELGVFRTVERNVIGADVLGEAIMTAEISASALAIARVPPLHGRAIGEADEHAGAPPVAVIGHDVWQSRFSGDPRVVGRVIQIGATAHTIIGVMPQGFGFPRAHSLWVPIRTAELQFDRRQGPWVFVVGRLAPGVSIAEAQAELTAFGDRAAAAFPDTHEHLRPEIIPYALSVSPSLELSPTTFRAINIFFVMLLVLVCANVALLTFARAASRQLELIIRTALGASRSRIAGQLFAEALVLGGVALVIGLWAAGLALRWWLDVSRAEDHGRLAFWFNDSLGVTTIVYAALLTVLGAAIAGVVPALKVTSGRGLDTRLRQSTAGGGGLRFGGIWTAVIVAQVALTVAFPAAAFFVRQSVAEIRYMDAGFAAEQYLAVRLEMDPEFGRGADGVIRASFPEARFRAASEGLARRVSAEPGVLGVTYADTLPRTYHRPRRIEFDPVTNANRTGDPPRAGPATIAVNWFDVLNSPLLAGRAFTAADLEAQAHTVIVNESFVRNVLSGRSPIGLRLRELPNTPDDDRPGPWLEIIGVAPNLGIVGGDMPRQTEGYYRPAVMGAVQLSHLVVHVAGDHAHVAARVQALAATIDPGLRLHGLSSLGDGDPTNWLEFEFLFKLLTLVGAIALLLSLASIYAAMSFAVSRRTREIGIRVALGAGTMRVATATFARPLAQVSAGVLLGAGLTAALIVAIAGELSVAAAAAVTGYALLMLGVCLLPSVTPLRRALRVDATEALRAEA